MKHITTVVALLLSILPLALRAAPASASEVNPIEVGSTAPNVSLTQVDGQTVQLHEILSEQAAVIVFYRGSWCPYCTRHLASLAEVEEDLLGLGYQIIAVSPDRAEVVAAYEDESDLNYTLYSDSLLEASSAFGLTYQLDSPTLKKLNSHDIDVEAASGQKHHLLPVPAVYVVGQDGIIQFRYYNADYRTRLSAEDILEAVQSK